MEDRIREEWEVLSDSRGEGSDVISTSAILLSKSILCLFVFNILPPPSRGGVCVFSSEFWRWGTEDRADEGLTIWWASSVVRICVAHVWACEYFLWAVAFLSFCKRIYSIQYVKKNPNSYLFFRSPTCPALSITAVATVTRTALTWK